MKEYLQPEMDDCSKMTAECGGCTTYIRLNETRYKAHGNWCHECVSKVNENIKNRLRGNLTLHQEAALQRALRG